MTAIRDGLDVTLNDLATQRGWPAEWRGALTDDEWAHLGMRGEVERFEQGHATLDQLAETIYDARRVYIRRPTRKKKAASSGKRPDGRKRHLVHESALADVFMTDLERDVTDRFQVRAFREKILANTLITDVLSWLQEQVRQQDHPTVENGQVHLIAVRVDGEIVRRATRVGHPLEWLRQISEALADFYRWQPADAATFVLANVTPAAPAITAAVRRTWPIRARSTITLTIRPTATPKEVAAAYAMVRFQEFERRIRRVSPKGAALAAFVFRHHAGNDTEQMKAWNRAQRKSWRYKFPSVFRREADLALGSLMELQPHRSARQR